MPARSRGGALGGGRSPMDRAADGLHASGEALTAMYNAAAQVLPEALVRTDRALDLAGRAVVALERLSVAHARLADAQQGPGRPGGPGDGVDQ